MIREVAMNETSEMVERVARALFCVDNGLPQSSAGGESATYWIVNPDPSDEGQRDEYLSWARAAIQAMMEPTRGMLKAGQPHAGVSAIRTWSAMVQEALR